MISLKLMREEEEKKKLEEEEKNSQSSKVKVFNPSKGRNVEESDNGYLPPKMERMNPLLFPLSSPHSGSSGREEKSNGEPLMATIISVDTNQKESKVTESTIVVEGHEIESNVEIEPSRNTKKSGKKSKKKKKKRKSSIKEENIKEELELQEMKEKEEEEDETKDGSFDVPSDILCVLFSMPLAVRDNTGAIRAIDSLNFDDERRAIWNLLKEVRRNIGVKFDYATPTKLRDLVTMGCRALHFSGHGFPQFLCFEDGYGGLRVMEEGMLKSLCTSSKNKLDFVFVSACFSKNIGQAFVDVGIPHVVCVNIDSALLDLEARTFTRSFYLSLFVGQTVQEAFEIGCNMVETMSLPSTITSSTPSTNISPPRERAKFILLPEDGNHDVPIFPSNRIKSVSSWPPYWEEVFSPSSSSTSNNTPSITPDMSPYPKLSHLPTPPEDFIGREADMLTVIESLMRRRFVSLVGESGSGKSAIAASVSVYLSERNVLSDGIVFVNLERRDTHGQVLKSLVKGISKLFRARNVPFRYVNGSSNVNRRGKRKKKKKRRKKRGSWSATDGIEFDNDPGVITLPTPKFCERDSLEAEEMLSERFSNAQSLIVLDNIDDILEEEEGGDGNDLIHMIRRLFERSKEIRVLVTSRRPIFSSSSSSLSSSNIFREHHVDNNGLLTSRTGALFGNGVYQSVLSVEPLNLFNSLRLFSRFSPHFLTVTQRHGFVQSLLPINQGYHTVKSKDLHPLASEVLCFLHLGHAARIVQRACEIRLEELLELTQSLQGRVQSFNETQKQLRPSQYHHTKQPEEEKAVPVSTNLATEFVPTEEEEEGDAVETTEI